MKNRPLVDATTNDAGCDYAKRQLLCCAVVGHEGDDAPAGGRVAQHVAAGEGPLPRRTQEVDGSALDDRRPPSTCSSALTLLLPTTPAAPLASPPAARPPSVRTS